MPAKSPHTPLVPSKNLVYGLSQRQFRYWSEVFQAYLKENGFAVSNGFFIVPTADEDGRCSGNVTCVHYQYYDPKFSNDNMLYETGIIGFTSNGKIYDWHFREKHICPALTKVEVRVLRDPPNPPMVMKTLCVNGFPLSPELFYRKYGFQPNLGTYTLELDGISYDTDASLSDIDTGIDSIANTPFARYAYGIRQGSIKGAAIWYRIHNVKGIVGKSKVSLFDRRVDDRISILNEQIDKLKNLVKDPLLHADADVLPSVLSSLKKLCPFDEEDIAVEERAIDLLANDDKLSGYRDEIPCTKISYLAKDHDHENCDPGPVSPSRTRKRKYL